MLLPESPRPHRAGIYIDLENLGRDVQVSQNIIRYALEHWPAQYPPLSVIALYGPQRPGLWEGQVGTYARELQGSWPFSNSEPEIRFKDTGPVGQRDKNTSDIELALDACQDMLAGVVGFVAVLSNDSDFYTLFERTKALKDAPLSPEQFPSLSLSGEPGSVPFLLINHPAGSKVSQNLRLLPSTHRWELSEEAKEPPVVISNEQIAAVIIRDADIGSFGTAEIRRIISDDEILQNHRVAKYTGEIFDDFVREEIGPLLESDGVFVLDSERPLYAISKDAKESSQLPLPRRPDDVRPANDEPIPAPLNNVPESIPPLHEIYEASELAAIVSSGLGIRHQDPQDPDIYVLELATVRSTLNGFFQGHDIIEPRLNHSRLNEWFHQYVWPFFAERNLDYIPAQFPGGWDFKVRVPREVRADMENQVRPLRATVPIRIATAREKQAQV